MLVKVICVFFLVGVEAYSFGNAGKECGIEASEKLVHHNPWTVYLEFLDHGRLRNIKCGGTLIDSRHVVTAAHCVHGKNIDTLNVRLGEYDLNAKQECIEGVCTDRIVIIRVDSIIIHPGYKGNGVHDIAVLTLEKEAPYTDFIRPVCLPTGDLDPDVTFIAAGWGIIAGDPTSSYSHVKKIIPLPLFDLQKCREVYDRVLPNGLPESVICAGGQEGIDTCNGDSGGPLVWIKERAELWGVTSVGNIRCGLEGIPAIYTKVIDYIDWIHEIVSQH